MPLLKQLLIFLFLALPACATTITQVSSTTQTLTNQGLKTYAAMVLDIKLVLEGAQNCADFTDALDSLEGLRNCELEGTESTSVVSSQCQNTPFLGEGELTLEFINCIEGGVTLQGLINLSLNWNGVILDTLLTGAGVVVNGIPQSFTDLSIQVGSEDEPVCQGVLISAGEACGVTRDCNFCPF